MNKKTTLITLIVAIITAVFVYSGSNTNTISDKIIGFVNFDSKPQQLYRVYLAGKSIGLIESIEELEIFIDNKQTELKEKYNVNI